MSGCDTPTDADGDATGVATDGGTETVYVSITPDPETAEYDLLEVIARLEGTEIENLPSLYTQVDHMVERLFRNPPSPEAQVEVSFSYAGYRVTVSQGGDVKLVAVGDTLGE